jgi:hypothetical protein
MLHARDEAPEEGKENEDQFGTAEAVPFQSDYLLHVS